MRKLTDFTHYDPSYRPRKPHTISEGRNYTCKVERRPRVTDVARKRTWKLQQVRERVQRLLQNGSKSGLLLGHSKKPPKRPFRELCRLTPTRRRPPEICAGVSGTVYLASYWNTHVSLPQQRRELAVEEGRGKMLRFVICIKLRVIYN